MLSAVLASAGRVPRKAEEIDVEGSDGQQAFLGMRKSPMVACYGSGADLPKSVAPS